METTLMRRAFPFVCTVLVVLGMLGCGGSTGRPAGLGASGGPEAIAAPQTTDIDALPVPDGVDTDVWAQLTAELGRVLAEYATDAKAISAPPSGAAGVVEISYYEPSSTLRWLYANSGDYDQNGLVGVSDLTPLGVHFGEESPGGAGTPFPPESLGAAIDGNSDGLIGVGDITPIGQNFGRRVEGYRVYAALSEESHPADPDGTNGPGTAWLDTVELAAGDAGASRLSFFHQVVPTLDAQHYWVRPYHGMEDGSASNAVQVTAPPKKPPVAVLSAEGNTETLAHIVWDADASHDPDGVITKYEWDFDGDGIFEYDSEGAYKIDFYYYEAGDYSCTVRVTDDSLMTDEATETVHVTEQATWHESIADEQLNGGDDGKLQAMCRPAKLVDIGSWPAIFYVRIHSLEEGDPFAYDLRYIRANDQHGASWSESIALGPATGYPDNYSFFGAAAMVEGRPTAAYTFENKDDHRQFLSHSIMFIRALDAEGASWPAPRELYNSEVYNDTLSPYFLASVDGRLAIAGGDRPYGAYNCILAENLNGTIWGDPYDLAEYLYPESATLAAVNDSLSTVRFANNEDLLYRRSLDYAALDWAEPVLVDQLEKVEGVADLLDVGGFPAVVYYDDSLGGMKYRRALNADGTQWGPLVVLTTQSNRHHYSAIIDGRPVVLFKDRIDDQVKLVAANDPDGLLWGFPAPVPGLEEIRPDQGGLTFAPNASFEGISGLPAIADIVLYHDEEDNSGYRLRYLGYY